MSKEALRIIRKHLDGDTLQVFVIAVYLALCENASDKGSESFQTLQSHISLLAGDISTRTVQRCLPILREIGLIDYETPKLRGPITFTLLSVASNSQNDATEGRDDTTDRRSVTTESKTASQAYNRRTKEELLEETTEEQADFNQFWEVYPVKVAKPKALAAWRKAKLPPIKMRKMPTSI